MLWTDFLHAWRNASTLELAMLVTFFLISTGVILVALVKGLIWWLAQPVGVEPRPDDWLAEGRSAHRV